MRVWVIFPSKREKSVDDCECEDDGTEESETEEEDDEFLDDDEGCDICGEPIGDCECLNNIEGDDDETI